MTSEERSATSADGSMQEANRLMMGYAKCPDIERQGAALFYLWTVRDAFLAGVKWERERREGETK